MAWARISKRCENRGTTLLQWGARGGGRNNNLGGIETKGILTRGTRGAINVNPILIAAILGIAVVVGMWYFQWGPFESKSGAGIDFVLSSDNGENLTIFPGQSYTFEFGPLHTLKSGGVEFTRVTIRPWIRASGTTTQKYMTQGTAVLGIFIDLVQYGSFDNWATGTGPWDVGVKNYVGDRLVFLRLLLEQNPSIPTGSGEIQCTMGGMGVTLDGQTQASYHGSGTFYFSWTADTLTITAGVDYPTQSLFNFP